MNADPKFVYVTLIATTPEKLWTALTDPKFTVQYWGGTSVESDGRAHFPVGLDTRAAPVLHGELGVGQCGPEFLRCGGDERDIDEFWVGIHEEWGVIELAFWPGEGEWGAGLEQGLEAAENRRPAIGNIEELLAAWLEAVVDDGEFRHAES